MNPPLDRVRAGDLLESDICGWRCMWRSDGGKTGGSHGRLKAIINDALRLGATSISVSLETNTIEPPPHRDLS